MVLEKKINEQGGKAWQKNDVDRTVPYKIWMNNHNTNGFWLDADAIKWRKVNGEYKPIAITELTACDWETIATDTYLRHIEKRLFERDSQGEVIIKLGKMLNVPVYWVVFPPSINWVYVYSCKKKKWKLFQPPEKWLDLLRKL